MGRASGDKSFIADPTATDLLLTGFLLLGPAADSSSTGARDAGIVIGVLLVLGCALAACAVWRWRRHRNPLGGAARRKVAEQSAELYALLLKKVQSNFLLNYRQLMDRDLTSFEEFEEQIGLINVPASAVVVGAELGRGNYGRVHRAQLTTTAMAAGDDTDRDTTSDNNNTNGASGVGAGAIKSKGRGKGWRRAAATKTTTTTTVAVKIPTPPGSSSSRQQQQQLAGSSVDTFSDAQLEMEAALLLEALVLHGLKHQYIVSLVAIAARSQPVMLLLEYMPGGDLRSVLRKCRPTAGSPKYHMGPLEIAQMSARLSSAMSFLERHRIIHRDVAARNVLVGDDILDVKLGDLGAARNVKREVDYAYVATSTATTHAPARWMPLEAIRDVRFSHKSDVFSFGVLLWEICSFARPPWASQTNEQ